VHDLTSGLGTFSARYVAGSVTGDGATAIAPLTSIYHLPGIGNFRIHSRIRLSEKKGRWLIDWSPSAVSPALGTGDRLVLTRTWAPRAPILGAGGAALTTTQTEVQVGVEGSRIQDPAAVSAVLEAAGASTTQVAQALAAAKTHPSYFEPVFQLTEAAYQALGGDQSSLHSTPGTVFEQLSARVAITSGLASGVVGSVGPVTAQELAQLGPTYDASSVVGQSGIEQAYERQLAGSPGGKVSVMTADGTVKATVASFSPKPGTPVRTSINPAVQQAAETALSTLTQQAALVAVDASTGQVLASVSSGPGSSYDLALAGEYPPGSSFKVVTSTALFETGLSPSSPASCPPTAEVGGETFNNAEGENPVSTLEAAFVESCNTAFVQLAATHLSSNSLSTAAAQFGIGQRQRLGLASFAGSVPTPVDQADLAASAIGQGRVVVSPLDMAMVAASIDTGTVLRARLVQGAPDDASPARQLPAGVAAALQPMMAGVVSSGTAAGTGLPSGTYAKTGTAQYGSGNPLPTDAWLIGYRGNVAFAMVVHGGYGNGGPTDGPVVARFLDALG
jgi:cell division protein FtsI/penicillin-binding protein 2